MSARKIILYGIGGVVVAGVLAVGAVLVVVDGAFVKDRLVRYMKEEQQRTLSIEGVPKLALYPVLRLELGKAALSERASEQTFVSFEAMRVGVRTLPLLQRRAEVETLAISGLRANIVRRKDGSLNLDDFGRGEPGEKERAEAPPQVHIAGLSVERAHIAWRDQASGQEIDVADLEVKTGALAADTPSPVSLSANVKGRKPAISVTLALSGSMKLQPARQRFEIAGLKFDAKGNVDRDQLVASFAAPELSVTPDKAAGKAVSGQLSVKGPQRRIEATLKMSALEGSARALAIPALSLELDSTVEGNAVKGSIASPVSGNLEANTWELPKIVANLTFSGPAIPQKSVTLPIQAALKADLAKRTGAVDLATKFDESNIKAKVSASRLAPVVANFDLQVDRINVDRYVAQKPAGKGDDRVDLSGLRGPTLQGKAAIGALQVQGVKLADVKAEIKLANGRLEVSPHSARLYEGSMAGAFSADANGNRIAVKETLTGVQVGPLLRDYAKKDILEGKGNIALDVQTAGGTVSALKRALAGNARIQLSDGAVKGINLAESFRNFKASLGAKSTSSASDARKQTDFSEMSASFNIKNGVAHNEDLKAASPFLRLGGAGDINIGASSIDYLAKATVVATSKGQGGKEASQLAGLTVPVRLTGPLDKPNWSIEYAAIAGDLLKSGIKLGGAAGGAVGEAAGAAAGAVGGAAGAIGEKLKGLFGR
jgi:AsmA protein